MNNINYYKSPPLHLSIQDFYHLLPKKYSCPPIFIGGCGRSGTTLLQSILSAHEEIDAINPETVAFYYGFWSASGPRLALGNLIKELKALESKTHAKRFLEKTPRHVKCIEEINKIFKGNFRFIQIVRDGRDVVCSIHKGENPNAFHVEPKRWVEDVKDGLKYLYLDQVLLVKYEDLLSNFDYEIQRICSFLNIEYSRELQDWYRNSTIKENHAFNSGVLKELDTFNSNKWKNTKFQKRISEFMDYPGAEILMRKLRYI